MFLLVPHNRRNFPSWQMAIAVVVETLPLLLLIIVLCPALLVGPLFPGRQQFTLRLLDALQQWDHRLPRT
ncbi:hypothetical protein ACWDLG_10795 [Nonomuraea sp. NPDC003727]